MGGMRLLVPAIAAVLALSACGSSTAGHGQVEASSCRPVFFGVPGSGQGLENPPPAELPDAVSAPDAASYGTTVGLLKSAVVAIAGRELASATAIDYPATPVSQYIGPTGIIGDLAISEDQGIEALLDAVRTSYGNGCPERSVLLAGYSQGAEVVIRSVNRLTPGQQEHVAVALFGNPSYVSGVAGDYPGGTGADGVRPSLLHLAYQLPNEVRFRTIDVCAPGDGVCNVSPNRTSSVGKVSYVLSHTKEHTQAYAFTHPEYVAHAAQFLWDNR
ncbi:MAG: hypothetical protein QOI15_749 [Pseudonocardiales bacterium]|nr:hypothetical protein [Pseudonocardiales bacterium]